MHPCEEKKSDKVVCQVHKGVDRQEQVCEVTYIDVFIDLGPFSFIYI